jgi:ppGpp synthetase/RelA/SpoT-type nucleotidyltranferase
MAWTKPLHDRAAVNTAGATIIDPKATSEALVKAHDVINNWRAAHGLPLTVFGRRLRTKSKRIDSAVNVGQRTKRLVSIKAKLEKMDTLKLATMQDIGGCRAIVNDVGSVWRVVDEFVNKGGGGGHTLEKVNDYINTPRDTGYRSVHLIWRYVAPEQNKAHNGLRIEMQIRSYLQHVWATSVEMVGAFTGDALKASSGSADWKRMFALVSTALALQEDTAPVPGTPTRVRDLVAEMEVLSEKLKLAETLRGFGSVIEHLAIDAQNGGYLLVLLDIPAKTTSASWFHERELEAANAAYVKLEKEIGHESNVQAVLVSVESVAELQEAFPNMFMETSNFVRLVEHSIEGMKAEGNIHLEWKPSTKA